MDSDNKNKVDARQLSAFKNIKQMHPINMLLYFSMAGISVLFIILVIAFIRTGGFQPEGITMPKFFTIGSFLLIFSSYTISRVPGIYKKDKLKKMTRHLGITLLLGLLFIGAQVLGWREIAASGFGLTVKVSGTYFYLISALHILHLLGGLIFLSFLFFKTTHVAADGIRTLVFIRDPYRRLQLIMLSRYWHFMNFLWLSLFVVFLFML